MVFIANDLITMLRGNIERGLLCDMVAFSDVVADAD